MRRLADATLARIGQSLAGWPRGDEVRTYVATVVWQWSNTAGDVPADEAATVENDAATQVLQLIEDAAHGGPAFRRAVEGLANRPVLLSAFFQNLDLLPAESDPQVDAIAMMVGDAVHRLSQTLDPGPDTL